MIKPICFGLLFTVLIGCGKSDSKSESPETSDESKNVQFSLSKADLTSLISKFDEADLVVEKLEDWPKEVEAKTFLNALNPALPKLLGREVQISNYAFLPFKKIPKRVREDILSSTLPEGEHPGYAVFLRSTWQKLFELQDQGFEIGMLNPGPKNRIAGIYSHDKKRIGLDTIASEGTLVHEFRHAEQYLSTDATRTGKIEGLSDECYGRVSAMFAETDATNIELPTWFGNMQRVTFEAEWFRNREKVLATDEDPVNYPFSQNFETAIYYPSKRAREVSYNNTCPAQILDFANALKEKMERAGTPLAIMASFIAGNRSDALYGWQSYWKNCAEDKKPIVPGGYHTEETCSKWYANNEVSLQKGLAYQKDFDRLLAEDIAVRTGQLQELYRSAPYFKEFCREMPGFKFYADCPSE